MEDGGLGAVSSSFTSPVFAVNEDLRYVYTGTTSLKAQFRHNRRQSAIDGVGFRTLTEQVNYDWNQYDEEQTYLEWHLYNATERELKVTVIVYSTKDEDFTTSYTIPPQSWGSYGKERVLLREINDAFTGEGLDVMSIGFMFGGLQNDGDTVYLDGIRFV